MSTEIKKYISRTLLLIAVFSAVSFGASLYDHFAHAYRAQKFNIERSARYYATFCHRMEFLEFRENQDLCRRHLHRSRENAFWEAVAHVSQDLRPCAVLYEHGEDEEHDTSHQEGSCSYLVYFFSGVIVSIISFIWLSKR